MRQKDLKSSVAAAGAKAKLKEILTIQNSNRSPNPKRKRGKECVLFVSEKFEKTDSADSILQRAWRVLSALLEKLENFPFNIYTPTHIQPGFKLAC